MIHFIKNVIIGSLKFYQKGISPYLGARCRFYPTCSTYAIECYTSMSLGKATLMVFQRLMRCHPWHPGGIDFPKRKST